MADKKEVHLIGNAHLDPIWLWRWQEGCGEVLQTFRSALDRLNEYPDFVFTCSSAAYYRWVEEIAPEMFEEIRARVKEGRWVPVNGWWVQPDCNMPSMESVARQALYSQLYYFEKFGVICRTGYNVDSFGHNYMIPQLLKQAGMDFYVMNRPSSDTENTEIPKHLFWWESPDGSRVLTYHLEPGYAIRGAERLDAEIDRLSKAAEDEHEGMMLFYGVGNHGGGPTRGDLDHLTEKMAQEGYRNVKFSSPDQYFRYVLAGSMDVPVWRDDLQHHASGCYAVTSMVKQLNRKAESALQSAEVWDTLSASVTAIKPETGNFAEAWRDVLFNQFHDILDGCSIMEAYGDVNETMGHALTIAVRAQNKAQLRIANTIDTWLDGVSDPVNETGNCAEVRHESCPKGYPRPIVVFNPLSWDVTVPVQTYQPSEMVRDANGNNVLFQNVRSSRSNDSHQDTVFLASVPAMGYATYWLYARTEENGAVKSAIRTHVLQMENEYIRVSFDRKTGCISYLGNHENKANYLRSPGAVPQVICDKDSDTWAHAVFRFHNVIGTMQLDSIEMVESGPLRAVIRVKHTFGKSYLTQNFILEAGQKTLRVECRVLWQEPLTLLKLAFPVAGSDEISTYGVPAGWIKRPCNGEEEPGQQWGDVTADNGGLRRGISILSDSKYSYDCDGAQIRLTALRNMIFADHFSSRPAADFSYTDEGLQRFEYGIYLHEGEAEDSGVIREAMQMAQRPVTVPVSYHKGSGAPQVRSFLTVSAENIAVTALKYCEDGSGDLILRCFETHGKACRTQIRSEALGFAFWSDFDPHQIKTYRIAPDGHATVVNFLEGVTR